MSKTFTSFGALKAALQKELYVAINEVIETSFEDLQRNVDNFYDSPLGAYQRIGQLAESPEMEIYGGRDVVSGELRLDTNHLYFPSGRDTQTIYRYAEDGGLLGNGGFWEQTKEDVKYNIQKSFGKRFK